MNVQNEIKIEGQTRSNIEIISKISNVNNSNDESEIDGTRNL